MTDRELLMAAAHAFWAGEIDDVCSIEWSGDDDGVYYTHADNQDHNGRDRAYRWNPLQESADAFELAARLKLSVMYGSPGFVQVSADDGGEHCTAFAMEPLDAPGCEAEATRRAIVRCAAALQAPGAAPGAAE